MRPDRFELPAFWFVARRSIQLSYGRNTVSIPSLLADQRTKFALGAIPISLLRSALVAAALPVGKGQRGDVIVSNGEFRGRGRDGLGLTMTGG